MTSLSTAAVSRSVKPLSDPVRKPGANRAFRSRYHLAVATEEDREAIYQIRHRIYASELGQHSENASGRLCDRLDEFNIYLVVKVEDEVVGFVSLTPPAKGDYSIDKYFDREVVPVDFEAGPFEIRLLTVLDSHRNRDLAFLLGYAAYRWVEAHGGTQVVGMGRRELAALYRKVGLKFAGPFVHSGAVRYDLMHASIGDIAEKTRRHPGLLSRIEARTDWDLSFPIRRPSSCFHGGAFFEAVGDGFEKLDRRDSIINADVLDAWFPPAPGVIETLKEHLPWLLRTSPPTDCGGLIRTVAERRGLREATLLPGAGSSDLIFRALRHWLNPRSRVLILDPTYGEYGHVLSEVIGCQVDRLALDPEQNFRVNPADWEEALQRGYDLVVLVNPNSPTGRHLSRDLLEPILRKAPAGTRIWVDETYIDYVGAEESLETFAAESENVIVCKSLSKVLALSGARAAYLCAGPHQLEALRALTPPWAVSLPGQVAVVRALEDPNYYQARYSETAVLRRGLADQLTGLGWRVIPGVANFLLCEIPGEGPGAEELVSRCRKQGLFLRNPGSMGSRAGNRLIRVAVKDAATNRRMIEILKSL